MLTIRYAVRVQLIRYEHQPTGACASTIIVTTHESPGVAPAAALALYDRAAQAVAVP